MLCRHYFIKSLMTVMGFLYFSQSGLALEMSFQAVQRESPGFRVSGSYLLSDTIGLELTLGKSDYRALKDEDEDNLYSSFGLFIRTPLQEQLSWITKTMVGYETFIDEIADAKRRHIGFIGTDFGFEVRIKDTALAGLIGTGFEFRSQAGSDMYAGSDRYRSIAVYPYIGFRSFY